VEALPSPDDRRRKDLASTKLIPHLAVDTTHDFDGYGVCTASKSQKGCLLVACTHAAPSGRAVLYDEFFH
jgi:hypothetical protein